MYAEIKGEEMVMPHTIELIIIALCADYPRREKIILSGNATYRVIMEYRFLNYRIFNAASEVAGYRDAKAFIKEIGEGSGYTASELWRMSESLYKQRKREVKRNIARRLCLYE